MGEPDEIRRLAERKRLQEEADAETERVRLAEKERLEAIEENAKQLRFRNADGSIQQRK